MDGREAMHTVMSAKLDGVPKMFDAYVLKKDGCVYDFVDILGRRPRGQPSGVRALRWRAFIPLSEND